MMRKILLGLAMFIFSAIGTFAQATFNVQKMDSLVEYWNQSNKIWGTVLLTEKGNVIYQKSLGNARIKSGKNDALPNTAQTMYRIGSISKTYTATLIMQLEDVGTIKLTDTLKKFYPKINNADKITIKQLLNHSSGLPNFTDDSLFVTKIERQASKLENIKWLEQTPADFAPGTKHEYSNSNYLVLGWILEDVTHKSYEQNLQEKIITPLVLRNTFTMNNVSKANVNIAHSYVFNMEWVAATNTHGSVPGAAGSVVSSAEDVAKFYRGLMQAKILRSEKVDMMKNMEGGFGMGLFLTPFYGKKGYGHGGKIDGFNTMAAYFPNEDMSMVILSNATQMVINDAAIGMLSVYFNAPYSIPSINKQKVVLSTEQLQPYVGNYYNKDMKMNIVISILNNSLIAQATGQSSFPLSPIGNDTFEFGAGGIEIGFADITNNAASKMILKQNGMAITFNKVAAD